jgi:hypothetical protein
VVGPGLPREIQADHTLPSGRDVHESVQQLGGLAIEPTEKNSRPARGTLQGGIDNLLHRCTPMELRSKANLEGGHAFGRCVFADLVRHPPDRRRLLKNCQGHHKT